MEKKTIFDMGRDTVEQFKARPKIPLTVVLDNVRSLNNIDIPHRRRLRLPRAGAMRYIGHAALARNSQDGTRSRRLRGLAILPHYC